MPGINEFVLLDDDILTEKIKNIIRKNLKVKNKRTKPKTKNIYASLLGHCVRRAIYAQNENDEYDEETSGGYFYKKIGIAIEEILLNAFGSSLIRKQYPVGIFFPENINFNGFIDAIVKIDNNYFVVEIKTCSVLPEKPKLSHKKQAEVYSAITGLPYIVLYMARDGYDSLKDEYIVKAFYYPYDENISKEIVRNIFKASAVTKMDGKFIYGEKLKFIKDCEYCPFIDKCKRGKILDDFTEIEDSALDDFTNEIEHFFEETEKNKRINAIISR